MSRALDLSVWCLIGVVGCGPPLTGTEGGEVGGSSTADTGTGTSEDAGDTGAAECEPPMPFEGEALEIDAFAYDTLRGADGLALFSGFDDEQAPIALERDDEGWQDAGELPALLEGVGRQPFKVSDGRVLDLYASIDDLLGENTGPPGEYFVHERGGDGSWSATPIAAGDVEFGSVWAAIDGDRIALPGAGHTGTVGTFVREDDGEWVLDELFELEGDVARLSLSGDRLLVVLTDRNELYEHDGGSWQPLAPLDVDEGLALLAADGARYRVLLGERLNIYDLEGERPLLQSIEGPPLPEGEHPTFWWRWASNWIIHNARADYAEPVSLTVYRRGLDGLWSEHFEAVLGNHGDSTIVGDELLVHEIDVIRRYSLCAP